MAGEPRHGGKFQLSPVDRFGRAIEPLVLEVATQVVPRALAYAEKWAIDPAVAATLLEECAAAVSRVVQKPRPNGKVAIRDLQSYLFSAFIRRVNKIRRKMPVIANTSSAAIARQVSGDFELHILADEILKRCDPITRDMFYRRNQGLSWEEIGKDYSISAHAAESRFSQALQRVRKRLGLEE